MNEPHLPPTTPPQSASPGTLPDPPPEEYPRRFGNYTLVAPIARGGMGEVFLAKTGGVAGLEKRCVVKTLRPHLTDDREYVARFVDEARIVVQLGHRNICTVFDVGTVGERYYLAMEYVAGRDVKTLQARSHGGAVDKGIAIHIVGEVLEALDYAHRYVDEASGRPLLLVHRDVSPQNIMLSFEGEVKLIDFGLAASTIKLEQTQPNVVMGKLAYMSPEQVRGDRVDGRADLFAVGVCLYELLTGERFYEGRSPYEIWGIAAQGGFRPRLWESLPPVLRSILDKALAADPAQRFATGLEMRTALEAYRFENGLRGDGPALRAVMQRLFEPEIEENKRLLQLLAGSKVGGDSGPQRHSSLEPTMSIARAISGPLEHKDATEPTRMMLKKAFPPRRRAATVTLLVVALVSASVAFVASDAVRERFFSTPEVIDLRPTSVVATPVPPTPVPEPVAVPPSVVDAGTLAQMDPAPEVPVAEPPDPVAKPSATKRPRPTDGRPLDARPDKKPPPVEESPATETAAATPPGYASLTTKGERVMLLKKHCSAPCVTDVDKAFASKEWVKDDQVEAFTSALKACWVESCKLPR